MVWKIGCSGYHYPEWRSLFYPNDLPQRKWFEYYCEHFNTLELNSTYYRFPREEHLRKWYAQSPPGFTFTLNVPRHITHFKKFVQTQRMLHDFNETAVSGLEDKLGGILFQFPADFEFEADRLARMLDILDLSVRNVFEFRHPSWWTLEVYEALSKAGIAFAGMSHPRLPAAVVRTTDILYYRFHGVPFLYNSSYGMQELEQTMFEIIQHRSVKTAYVYFNNTAQGQAVINAQQLQQISQPVH